MPSPGPALAFAGAAASGKTTVARTLARILRVPYHGVEAEECWPLPPGRERQRCFLHYFKQRLLEGAGVYDNHYWSVYAYSLAMGVLDVAQEALVLAVAGGHRVVFLAASPGTLRERIRRRLAAEPIHPKGNRKNRMATIAAARSAFSPHSPQRE